MDKFVLQQSGPYDFESKVFAGFVLTNIWLLTNELAHLPTTVVQFVTLLSQYVPFRFPVGTKVILTQKISGIPQFLRINPRTEPQTKRSLLSSSSFPVRRLLIISHHLQRIDNTL